MYTNGSLVSECTSSRTIDRRISVCLKKRLTHVLKRGVTGLLVHACLCFLLVYFGYVYAGASQTDEAIEYSHGLSLIHDLKYGPDFSHFEYLNPHAPKGGDLVLSAGGTIKNFTWVLDAVIEPVEGIWRTYDRLLMRSADELSGFYGLLAQGIALSEDRRTLYLRLHPDARWHDGVPLTAHDVKYSFDRAVQTLDGRVFMQWLESVSILGERELALHHRETYTNANLLIVAGQLILPRHYWKDRDPTMTHSTPSVGSGPYRVADYGRSFVVYERVPHYWGRDLPVNRGRYNFDRIRHEIYRDGTVAREAFFKGQIDVHFEGDVRYWKSSQEMPAVADGSIKRDSFRSANRIGSQFVIVFNADSDLFSDVRVREALTLAFDFEWQNRALYHGLATRANSYFAGSVFASSELPTDAELELLEPYRDQLQERVFTQTFQLPVSSGRNVNREFLSRATELLRESGWEFQDFSLVNKHGKSFEFEILNYSGAFQRVLIPFAEALKKLGIIAHVRMMDSAQFIRRRRARDFEALIWQHDLVAPPTTHLRTYFHSWAANPGMMTYNITNIRHPVVDALVEQAERARSYDELVAATRALDRVLLWNFYNIPLNGIDESRFLYWNRFGRPTLEYTAGYGWPFVEGWWLDAAKVRNTSIPSSISH